MDEAVLTNHIVLDTIPLDTVPPLDNNEETVYSKHELNSQL